MPAGRVLLPGLFDMHAHTGFWDGGLHLAAGVTTDPRHGQRQRDAAADHRAGGGRHAARAAHRARRASSRARARMPSRSGFVIKNLDEAKHAVDWYHEHGYPQIKIYNSFPKDDPARGHGVRAQQGHARQRPHPGVPARAGCGARRATTRSSTSTRCCSTSSSTTRPTRARCERFYLPAEKVADLDFDSKPVQDFIALLVQHKTVIDPTLATFDFIRQRDGEHVAGVRGGRRSRAAGRAARILRRAR